MANPNMFSRNYGYIDDEVQKKMNTVKVLIAGCGLGSYIAEALVRIKCSHFILVDHDTIDIHNLNRQNYLFGDIGHFKAERLKHRMHLINPDISINCICEPVSESNAKELVSEADIIIDTIDFLSAKALLELYEQCYLQKKMVISSLSAGWGAVAFYIPPSSQTKNWFKEIFEVSDLGNTDPKEYAYYFRQLIHSCYAHELAV